MELILSRVIGQIHFHAHGRVLLGCLLMAIILSCVRWVVSRQMTLSRTRRSFASSSASKVSSAALLILCASILPSRVSMAQHSAGVVHAKPGSRADTIARLQSDWLHCVKQVKALGARPIVSSPVSSLDVSPARMLTLQRERDIDACREQLGWLRPVVLPARSEIVIPIRKSDIAREPRHGA